MNESAYSAEFVINFDEGENGKYRRLNWDKITNKKISKLIDLIERMGIRENGMEVIRWATLIFLP